MKIRKYSVLLLYPHSGMLEDKGESYYDLVRAKNPKNAIKLARKHAVEANGEDVFRRKDFTPVLVIEGHHDDLLPPICHEEYEEYLCVSRIRRKKKNLPDWTE